MFEVAARDGAANIQVLVPGILLRESSALLRKIQTLYIQHNECSPEMLHSTFVDIATNIAMAARNFEPRRMLHTSADCFEHY